MKKLHQFRRVVLSSSPPKRRGLSVLVLPRRTAELVPLLAKVVDDSPLLRGSVGSPLLKGVLGPPRAEVVDPLLAWVVVPLRDGVLALRAWVVVPLRAWVVVVDPPKVSPQT